MSSMGSPRGIQNLNMNAPENYVTNPMIDQNASQQNTQVTIKGQQINMEKI